VNDPGEGTRPSVAAPPPHGVEHEIHTPQYRGYRAPPHPLLGSRPGHRAGTEAPVDRDADRMQGPRAVDQEPR